MARRGSKRLRLLILALALEALFIIAIPLAANISVPVSTSQCPPPVTKPVKQAWIGSLVINVASLEMKLRGAKRIEPFILVRSAEGGSTKVSLGIYNSSSVKIMGVSRVVKRFVGPMLLNVIIGDNVSGVMLPPSEAYYDPSAQHYVFQYFYPGTNTVATIFVKPLYREATVVVSLREPARVGIELCIGKSCRLAKMVSCNAGNCTIKVSSPEPFQYTKLFYVYRCGFLNAIASEEKGLRIELRENFWIPLAVFSVVAAITIFMGAKRTIRFK